MAKRGIDGDNIEQQVEDAENRGKELLKDYIEKKGDEMIPRKEADDILEPLKGAFQLMENAINLSGTGSDGSSGLFTSFERAGTSAN